ncbi:hypothetical protein PZW06_24220, partial [Klebsiella pneumoniae]
NHWSPAWRGSGYLEIVLLSEAAPSRSPVAHYCQVAGCSGQHYKYDVASCYESIFRAHFLNNLH